MDLIEQAKYAEGYADARDEIRSQLQALIVQRARSTKRAYDAVGKDRSMSNEAAADRASTSYMHYVTVYNVLFENDGEYLVTFFDTTQAPKGMTDDQWISYLTRERDA